MCEVHGSQSLKFSLCDPLQEKRQLCLRPLYCTSCYILLLRHKYLSQYLKAAVCFSTVTMNIIEPHMILGLRVWAHLQQWILTTMLGDKEANAWCWSDGTDQHDVCPQRRHRSERRTLVHPPNPLESCNDLNWSTSQVCIQKRTDKQVGADSLWNIMQQGTRINYQYS